MLKPVLHSVVQNLSVWRQIRSSTAVALATIVFTIFFGFLLIRYVTRQMIQPMKAITSGMERIDKGEYDLRIEGEFEKDDIVKIVGEDGQSLGVGKVQYDSRKARELLGRKNQKPLIHCDYLYLE